MRDHLAEGLAAAEEYATQIDAQDMIPGRCLHLLEPRLGDSASSVDEDIEWPECLRNAREQRLNTRFVGDIARASQRNSAIRLDLRYIRCERVAIAGGERHHRACLRECAGGGFADTPAGASHERHLPMQCGAGRRVARCRHIAHSWLSMAAFMR